jgi:hypothetical protein
VPFAFRPKAPVDEIGRVIQRAKRWVMVAWAGGIEVVFTAGIDGSVPRFGLLGILTFVGFVGYLLVMGLVDLRLGLFEIPWSVPGVPRLQIWLARPRVALGLCKCGAVIAAIYALFGVWHRVAHRAWVRFPVWNWGMDFDLLLVRRENLGSAAFTAAVVLLLVASTKVRRIVTNAGAKPNNHG